MAGMKAVDWQARMLLLKSGKVKHHAACSTATDDVALAHAIQARKRQQQKHEEELRV